jgi:hypothetical protein
MMNPAYRLLVLLAIAAAVACGTYPSAAARDQAPLSERAPAADVAGVVAPVPPDAADLTPAPELALAPAEQDDPAASEHPFADRALAVVRVLAEDIGSRPAGSEAERRAATYLAGELGAMGYTVDVPSFRYSGRTSSGTTQNVVAVNPAEDPSAPLVVIGAHYDSVPQGPGANDNGSGTATMVEVARELMRSPVPNVAVRYVAFGAEEVGLHGSAEYVRQLSQADRGRLKVAISVDMMAVGDRPAFGGSQPWVADAMARAASQGYRPADLSSELRRLSDHASFLDAGLPAVMFHWVDDPFYHTRMDVSPNVQWWSLELMGAIAIELTRLAALR